MRPRRHLPLHRPRLCPRDQREPRALAVSSAVLHSHPRERKDDLPQKLLRPRQKHRMLQVPARIG